MAARLQPLRDAGARVIETPQHAGNAPLLRLNRRVGFRRGLADIRPAKPLAVGPTHRVVDLAEVVHNG
jgi:hypothetical protein